MSDPKEIQELLEAAEDAFGHAEGRPEFEPELNASQDAESGEVQIQKACRLLGLARDLLRFHKEKDVNHRPLRPSDPSRVRGLFTGFPVSSVAVLSVLITPWKLDILTLLTSSISLGSALAHQTTELAPASFQPN
jgi:hypothetical protein